MKSTNAPELMLSLRHTVSANNVFLNDCQKLKLLLKSINSEINNESPGSDGLTAEF